MLPDLASLTYIAQQTTNGVIITDREGRCVWANDSFTRSTGYTLAELAGQVPGRLLQGPETDRATAARMAAAVREGREFSEELINYDKAGRPYWTAIQCAPIRDETGAIRHFVAIQSDVTERRARVDALRQTAESLRAIIAAMPLVVFATDTAGRFTLLEGMGLEKFGASPSDALGRSAYELSSDPTIERNIRRALAGETFMANVVTDELVFETRYSPLRNGAGAVVGCLGVALDVTEQMQATAELVRAKDAAEAATRAKSAFLATMSHEIRTPLNAVIGTADLLLDISSSEEQRRYAETIRTSGDMLLAVIDDILDFSKIEAGNMELEHRPFDLRATVSEVVELLAPRAAEKALGLAAAVDAAVPPRLVGDRTRIRQILVNLVGNALKFTDRGEVLIRALCRQEGPAGAPELELAVSDTGIGIPQDRLGRLFQPFSQVDASTTRRYGGTGLGLAICKRLCELMGGWIAVRSAVGEGSTFTVRLPIAVAAPQPQAAGPEAAPRPAEEVAPLRILLAEDNSINQQVALRMLERLGYSADLADNGLAVLGAFEGRDYDVVLMDVQMPELDGLEATRRLRAALPAHRQPRIIAMTANALVGDRDACLAGGMDDYISKPVQRESLAAALRRVPPRPAPPPASERIDHGIIGRLRADLGPDFAEDLGTLVETYRRQLRADVASLREAQRAGDGERVALLAHRLRGASVTLGARQAELVCRELEQPGKAPEAVAALIEALLAEGEQAADALALVVAQEHPEA